MSTGFTNEWYEAHQAKEASRISGNRAALEQGPKKARKGVAKGTELKKKPSKHEESDMQKQCVRWFRLQYKREVLFAVPNGSLLAGDPKKRAIQAGILKAEGMLSGVSDLILVHDNGVAFLEAKTEKGTQSDNQRLFEAMVKAMGFTYIIFRSFDEFREAVEQILNK